MDYEAEGGITITGCATIKVVYNYVGTFVPGQRAYIKYRAEKGVLERVIIKKSNRVRRGGTSYTGSEYIFNYVDTLNRVWLEEELVSLSAAQDLVEAFDQAYAAEYAEYAKCLRD